MANAVSYLLSALGIRAIRGERAAARAPERAARRGDLLDGWRFILANAALRPLFLNTVLVNGLIMATAPLLAVLMLGELGFAPVAVRAGVRRAVRRRADRRAARAAGSSRGTGRAVCCATAGTLRACWSFGLAFVVAGRGRPRARDRRPVRPRHVRWASSTRCWSPNGWRDAAPARPRSRRTLVGVDGDAANANDRGDDRRCGALLAAARRAARAAVAARRASLLLGRRPLLLAPLCGPPRRAPATRSA